MSRCVKCRQCAGGYYAGADEMSWVECENVRPYPTAAERDAELAALRAENASLKEALEEAKDYAFTLECVIANARAALATPPEPK